MNQFVYFGLLGVRFATSGFNVSCLIFSIEGLFVYVKILCTQSKVIQSFCLIYFISKIIKTVQTVIFASPFVQYDRRCSASIWIGVSDSYSDRSFSDNVQHINEQKEADQERMTEAVAVAYC